MIYANPSFLTSLYTWDANTQTAQKTYASDQPSLGINPLAALRVPQCRSPGGPQNLRGGNAVPFNIGDVLKRIDTDLSDGILRHEEPGWRETMRLAEDLSEQYTEALGLGAVDCGTSPPPCAWAPILSGRSIMTSGRWHKHSASSSTYRSS